MRPLSFQIQQSLFDMEAYVLLNSFLKKFTSRTMFISHVLTYFFIKKIHNSYLYKDSSTDNSLDAGTAAAHSLLTIFYPSASRKCQ